MAKKKILIHTNHSRILSGFGKNAKNILKYLADTGKYDLVEMANGVSYGNPSLETMPWKTLGGLPNDPESIQRINNDSTVGRSASYGALTIDKIIKDEKPDVYLGIEDIWGIAGYTKKPWWNKINCMAWTTLDSLPILPEAVDCAKKIKNYYVWASFAEKEMNRLGHDHVKTLHGCVDHKNFFKFDYEERSELRSSFGIDEDSFVIGFVFRNQLRKSVPNLLEGFKLFKEENPDAKAKLLLHTNFSEGWDIPRLLKEKSIDPNDILCTYYCHKCKSFDIRPFTGQKQPCRFCGSKDSQNTITITNGVDETQLNKIYNLMDVYCHPFTSGGQELPIQEAKLTELITLVTNYSCGTDSCSPESGGIPLDWAEYREPGTQFIKASTYAESIKKELHKVYEMDELSKQSKGKQARDYVIKNYSIESVGKKLEEIFDSMPEIDWDFNFKRELRNPDYPNPQIEDDSLWLIDLYKNILKYDLDDKDEGHQHWMKSLSQGATRESVYNYFRQVAAKENEDINKDKEVSFDDFLDENSNKRALFVLKDKEEDILLATALFESFKDSHPNYDIYFACDKKYHLILSSNPYIHSVLPYTKELENEFLMICAGSQDPYFDYYCNLGILTQKHINYRGIDNKVFELTHE